MYKKGNKPNKNKARPNKNKQFDVNVRLCREI